MIKVYIGGHEAYSFIKFPGEEWHVKSNNIFVPYFTPIVKIYGGNAEDLIKMSLVVDALRRDGYDKISLFMPYLPGARQDKRQDGEALSAKVYASIINNCNFEKVICIDPHSDVMPALINNCYIINIANLISNHLIIEYGFAKDIIGIISPDAGATKRANELAKLLSLPVYQALKKRDQTTGKLSNFTCEPLPENGKLLVVDDICDGGGTFKGFAKTINLPKERLELWVTHGIFSGTAFELKNYFSKIHTTNSHPGSWEYSYDDEFMRILKRYQFKGI